jgi:hypothetical protein
LLISEPQSARGLVNPVPQLITQVIAAFVLNNWLWRHRNLPALDSHLFPGIMMVGAMPTFFKICVTQALVDAVTLGEHLAEETIIEHLQAPLDEDGVKVTNKLYNIEYCFWYFLLL